MISSELFNDFKCCYPNRPEHFVHNEKILSCGHPVCQQCFKDNFENIKCSRCDTITNIPVCGSSDFVNKLSKRYIEAHLAEFSQLIDTKLAYTVNEIKCAYYLNFW
jgi:hypothetical protein